MINIGEGNFRRTMIRGHAFVLLSACAFLLLFSVKAVDIELRLVNGTNEYEGRVEVRINGTWGTICDSYPSFHDASVICRQLGFSIAERASVNSAFGTGSYNVSISYLSCTGYETSISDCYYYPRPSRYCDPGQYTVGVLCSDDLALRLVGGNTSYDGRLEVYHGGEWGTVCDDYFTTIEADIVCRQLGYPGVVSYHSNFGPGTGPIWIDNLRCGSEADLHNKTSIAQCSYYAWNISNCDHSEDVGVICQNGQPLPAPLQVRIVNGSDFGDKSFAGRVEIFYNNQWGTVCDDGWGIVDADVFCRQLGFEGADFALPGSFFETAAPEVSILVDEILCHGNENGISNCPHGPYNQTDCYHYEDAGVICTVPGLDRLPLKVSLVGLNSSSAGLLVLEYHGINGTVCDDYFDLADGDVFCRMLGFSHALEVKSGYYYYYYSSISRLGRGPVWLDDVVCNGTEYSIEDCSFPGWGISDCSHYEDVFLVCSDSPTPSQIRLVNGQTTYEGRVEILHNGRWGTVCNEEWDANDAKVVCGQLGFHGAASVAADGQFGRGWGERIWILHAHCTGTENFFDECLVNWGRTGCTHRNDAGVICTPSNFTYPVRLVNGSSALEGRVEVRASAAWGTICSSGFDTREATVVCRQLGYYGAVEVFSNSEFGAGTGPVVFSYMYCRGSEAELGDCYHYSYSYSYCNQHTHDVGIRCLENAPHDLSIRLVGGPTSNVGRVEVYIGGSWGTVCDDGWNTADAMVVCRQLGYPIYGARALSRAYYGRGSGSILMDDVSCVGGEASLLDCNSSTLIHNCGHYEDASVICPTYTVNITLPVRLMISDPDSGTDVPGTNEGRVEVYYNGTWGTICDNHWSFSDAVVVCRMLGYSSAVRSYDRAHFGPGSGKIWLDNVECSGREAQLKDCYHNNFSTVSCTHAQDAGVACTNYEQSEYLIRLVGNNGSASFGRVEIFYNGTWGTICNHGFGMTEANVVCNQLGFQGASRVSRLGEFPSAGSSTPIWLDDLSCVGSESTITECSFPGWGNTHCTHFGDIGVYCAGQQLKVRLKGGTTKMEGRVEVYYNNTWGTVCDDYWTLNDARVVCRELGFNYAAAAWSRAHFGRGTGPIWLDDVACLGTESSIFECSALKWNNSNCRHSEDAGVQCTNVTTTYNVEQVRLMGGRNASEGRVEIRYNGAWGTVCDDYWTIQDANVVCRQLGYRYAIRATKYASFGRGTGPILMDDVECLGTESQLVDCLFIWNNSDCSHYEDAGVVCYSPGPIVRLVGGSSDNAGRIEVFYNGTWGTVCDDGFGYSEGDVVCKELGYNRVLHVYDNAAFGQGTGNIWLDDVKCSGDETSLFSCQHGGFGTHNCHHYEDTSVVCTDIPINPYPLRLVDGNSTAGRVEIFYHGEWGSVCDDEWDMDDANVACRSLGFRGAWFAHSRAVYGQGTGVIWLDDVSCDGTELFIQNCSNSGFGVHNCQHFEDAGVSCIVPEYKLRIVNSSTSNPSTGRLEVFYNKTWGTICDDFFDIRAANVACRMLGFGGASAVYGSGRLSQGAPNQPIWLDDLYCQTGNETSFYECGKSDFGINNCQHSEDVGIGCYRSCPNVDIPHGSFQGEFSPGSQLSFSCNVGYVVVGNSTATCMKDSTWSNTLPVCKVGCSPISISNGDISMNGPPVVGTVATFKCNSGYTLQGNTSITCTSRAQWSGPPPSCASFGCSSISIPNGAINMSSPPVVGTVATFKCNSGYTLQGNTSIVCTSSGQWSGPPPSCASEVSCSPISISNGAINMSSPPVVGAVATFKCNSGYTLQGNTSIVCTSSGQWSGPLPSCASASPSSGNSAVAVVIGVIVAVVVVVVIVIVTVGIVAWQCGKWYARKRMYAPVGMVAENEAINFFTDEEGEEDNDNEDDHDDMADDEVPLDI